MTGATVQKRGLSEKLVEPRMVLSTIAGLWFGRAVWLPVEEEPDITWVGGARRKNLPGIIEMHRGQLMREYDGIEAVRRRAEFALTAIVAAAGLSATGFERLWSSSAVSPIPLVLWFLGLAIEVFAVLTFAGVAVASKRIGYVDAAPYSALKNSEREQLRRYVIATHLTSRTRRAGVTVFRDAFLIALVGLAFLGSAHLAAWAIPLPPEPAIIVWIVV